MLGFSLKQIAVMVVISVVSAVFVVPMVVKFFPAKAAA